MEIDSRLLNFKSEIGEQLNTLEQGKKTLVSDLEQLNSLNSSVIDNLNSSFKSEGGKTAAAQIQLLNETIVKLNSEIEINITGTISKSRTLYNGILNLEGIISNYNSKLSELNKLEKDNPKRSSVKSEIAKLESDFNNEHAEMLRIHSELLGEEASSIVIDELANGSNTYLDIISQAGFEGFDTSNSIFYEKDGIVYQKVIPYSKDGGLVGTYTIVYDKNKILQAVGNDSKAGQDAIKYLDSKVATGENRTALWQFYNRSYSAETCNDVAKIMDIILEDSYVANNCQSVSDYATVAGTVATNSLVHMKYDGANTSFTRGFNEVIRSGYDCIGFTTWAYYQGLSKVHNYGDNEIVGLTDVTCNGTYYHYGEKLENMSIEEISNIKPGAIVTRYGHIGMVIGQTTKSDGTPAVVIAHSAGTNQGTVTGTWPADKITNQWEKVMTPEDMTRRAEEGAFNGEE